MAATGYTPISLYYSTTAAAVPVNTNLVNGELAINITDGKLYYKDNTGTVKLLASNATVAPVTTFQTSLSGLTPSTATSGAVTLAGTLGVASGGTGLTSLTAGYVPYGNGTSAFSSSSNLYFNGSNLGIGTAATLASWSGFALQISTRASVASVATADIQLTNNAYWTGTQWNYLATAAASNYYQDAGSAAHVWRYASSGTAGTAITWTEQMRIDTSGNVGIGTNSPAALGKFVVSGSQPQITAQGGSTAGGQILVLSNGSTTGPLALGQGYASATDNIAYFSNNANADMIFRTNSTERIRILAGGYVGVGTTAPTAMLQTAGSSSVAAFKTPNIIEVATVSATAATGTINYDCTTQSVVYYTTNASGNWTINFRGSSGTALNSVMATGESMSFSFLATQGSTAYYNSSVQVDGTTSGVTTKWQGGSAPTSGNASSIDSYTYVIIKTGSATFTVLATQTKFA